MQTECNAMQTECKSNAKMYRKRPNCTHTDKHIPMHRKKNTHNLHTYICTETETNNPAHTPQHRCSAHNYRTYSLDYYHEYAYIKNSNTIELYTISK